jgi:orotidine-5'-phosphate decarboxylase
MSNSLVDELQMIADYFADAKSHDLEQTVLKTISRIKTLNEQVDWYRDRVVWGFHEEGKPQYYQGKEGEHEINDPITAQTANNLMLALDLYERERTRFLHANPEITGAYFLSGGYGDRDDNMLPQFVEIVAAYGCGWSQVYEKTERTISYEGS